ncbi:conserved hypothetical protein [Marinobacter salarius]|uniref:helix-turn-helix domain-containing protein n=1 Tax=Marinobacter salarius TaxID=1420917 RepID=UPI00125780F1|nr:helix-turn-helix domain-containing protein [Marinobacter salarius]VVT02942.1 conserved hypothetical protein [Marinobacter salarius]VXC24515.1 conserved hypothetical protein [Marinobacter salarius]
MSIQPFIDRLKYAIEQSSASQGTIAEYCGVSRQSVTNWKTTGQISRDNLRKVSEVTGFRYLWIKEGIGAKKLTDFEQNERDAQEDELGVRAPVVEYGEPDDKVEKLIRSIRYAMANQKLSDESLSALTRFFNSLVDFK